MSNPGTIQTWFECELTELLDAYIHRTANLDKVFYRDLLLTFADLYLQEHMLGLDTTLIRSYQRVAEHHSSSGPHLRLV